jgi:LuxR family maltose regulon positive regulatory protein
MAAPNIQNNKYTPNPLPEICARRAALLARLERAAGQQLVFICAPAGSGKTVGARVWMKSAGRKTVWIGLDAFDNTTSVFYRMFCTGILSAQPDNERMIAILRDPTFDFSPVEHTINLLAGFLTDGRTYALALDDFHTINNLEILKSLPYILRRMPHSFVTLILSRNDARREQFAALFDGGQAAAVGADDLAFGKDEIEEYFAATGRGAAKSEAEAAFTFTGGWAIGVNVLAHSAAPVPEGFGGHILENYITRHIWGEWDKTLRSFMITSAAFAARSAPAAIQSCSSFPIRPST